jgi:mRNA-degrading endonuclease RelE of RelBE toxin-antitoxin system
MNIGWDLAAQAFFDQLPAQEQARVMHAVQRLATAPGGWDESHLAKLTGPLSGLYSLRAGGDLRVLIRRHDDGFTIVDVVRRTQVEGLRRLFGEGQSAAE